MAAVAQIVLEIDDAGAIASMRGINAEGAKIAPGIAPAIPQIEKLSKSSKEARESAALISEEFGVRMPRAIRNVAAEIPGVGSALRAAFTGLAVAGFVEVLKNAADQLTGFSEQLNIIKKANESLMSSVEAANKTLMGPQTLQQVDARIVATTKTVEALNQQLGLTGDVLGDAVKRGMAKWSPAQQALVEDLDKQKGLLNDLYQEQAKLDDERKRLEPIEILKQQNAARLEGLEGIARIDEAERGQTALLQMEIAKQVVLEKVGQAEITAEHAKATAERAKLARDVSEQGYLQELQSEAAAAHGEAQIRKELFAKIEQIAEQEGHDGEQRAAQRIAAERDADSKIKELRRQAAEDTLKLEEEAAVATVPPWQRSYAQIKTNTQDKLREIQRALDETRISSEQAAEQSAAVWQINFAKTRDQLASDLESFFDDVTSGNIGKRFKKMFEDLVFQMVATWLLGMNKMRSASAGAFGGGGILGSLFGLGGLSGGPGGTPPFLGSLFGGGAGGTNADLISLAGGLSALPLISGGSGSDVSSGSIFGLGLSAGLGAAVPGVVLPSGSGGVAAGGIGGILGTLLTSNAFRGLALTGGIGLLASSFGKGGAGGILGSAAGGALIGSVIPGVGTLLGALIGGIVGLFSGLFGEHKGDKARKQVMEPLMAQVKLVKDSYDVFQTDYNTAVGELEKMRSDAISALKQIGGRQVSGNTRSTNKIVDDAESYIKSTEAERQRRAQLSFGPPQFERGGFVSPGLVRGMPYGFAPAMAFDSGGAVPAIVHAGEYVLNRRAVSRMGVGALDRMNADGAGGDTYHITINALDAKSVKELLTSDKGLTALRWAFRAGNHRGYF